MALCLSYSSHGEMVEAEELSMARKRSTVGCSGPQRRSSSEKTRLRPADRAAGPSFKGHRFPHNKILRYFLNCTAKRFNALRSKQTLTVLHPACSPTFLSQRRMSLGKSSSPRQTGRNTCVPVRFPARSAASTLFTPQRDVLGDDWQAER